MNGLYTTFGLMSITFGLVGIFVPVWPTTPFILLSVLFFSKTDKQFDNYILDNKWIGKHIRNYMEHKRMTRSIKIKSILFIWLGLGLSIYFNHNLIVQIILAGIGCVVTLHLALLKED